MKTSGPTKSMGSLPQSVPQENMYPANAMSRESADEELQDSKPRLEGVCRGSWWEVDIVQQRDKYYLVRYLSPMAGEEDAWLSLDQLRLKSRRSDDWDCNILKRGMDVTVNCTHPDFKELKLHTRALYDARITRISRASHQYECTCRFHVSFYCVRHDEDPLGSTKERPLLTHDFATRDVNISNVGILQQPGIVPFYEILKSHLSRKWIQVSRWSNDAYFLRETKLLLRVPPRECKGENSFFDDDEVLDGLEEALDATGATIVSNLEPVKYTREKSARERRTKSKVRNSEDFPGPYKGKSHTSCTEVPTSSYKDASADILKERSTGGGGVHGKELEIESEHLKKQCGLDGEDREDSGIDLSIRGRLTGGGGGGKPPSVYHRGGGSRPAISDRSDPQLLPRAGVKKGRDEIVAPSDPKKQQCMVNKSYHEDEIVDISGDSDEEYDIDVQASLRRTLAESKEAMNQARLREEQIKGPSLIKKDEIAAGSKLETDAKDKQFAGPSSRYDGRSQCTRLNSVESEYKHMLHRKYDRAYGEHGRKRGRPKSLKNYNDRNLKGGHGGYDKRIPTQRGSEMMPEMLSTNREERDPKRSFASAKTMVASRHVYEEEFEVEVEVVQIDPGMPGCSTGRTRIRSKEKKGITPEKAAQTHPEKNDGFAGDGNVVRLRTRKLGVKQQLHAGGSNPECSQERDEGGGPKYAMKPLYEDLLGDNLIQESGLERQAGPPVNDGAEPEKRKCGLNAHWDPLSFKYPVPVLEEKEMGLDPRNGPVVDSPDDSAEELEDTTLIAPQQDRIRCPCGSAHRVHKEDVGTICRGCGVILVAIEHIIPDVDTSQRRQNGDTSKWDIGKSTPDDALEEVEPPEYHKLEIAKADKEAILMGENSLPRRMEMSMHIHQREGFEFLWRNLATGEGKDRRMRQDRNAGCILSHVPGTGKTFLVICFLQSYMNQFPNCKPLIVAPKIMLRQWEQEFRHWKSDIGVYILNTAKESGKRLVELHQKTGVIDTKYTRLGGRRLLDNYRMAMLYEWSQNRSVMLVSYNMFSCLTDENRNFSSPQREEVCRILLTKPSLLVLDEGHFPRNKGTRIRQSLMKVKTNVRILLSGTLFQNNFEELFNTLYLVRPGFVEGFAKFAPKSTSDEADLTVRDFEEIEQISKEAERRARKMFVDEVGMKIEQGQNSKVPSEQLEYGLQRLGALTTEFVHHHAGAVLTQLPGLRDFAVILKPTPQQNKLLELLEKSFHRPSQYLEREIAVSQTSIHPILIKNLDFTHNVFDPQKMQENPVQDEVQPRSLTGSRGHSFDLSEMSAIDPNDGIKTKFVFDLIEELRCPGKRAKEKVLIFSQHITPLDLLIHMFERKFNWRENVEYLKLDGKLNLNERAVIIQKFNNPESKAHVLLASTKACGEGISLIGASRVVFLDVLWNPAVIKQAMSRAFRLGQKRIVYVYRLIASGTIEEKKYKKAIRKDWLSRSIFSAAQSRAHKSQEGDCRRGVLAEAGDANKEEDDKWEVIKSIVRENEEGVPTVGAQFGFPSSSIPEVPEELRKLRSVHGGHELLAWEVDVNTSKDSILEKILGSDKLERNTFLKVVEHGSDFRDKEIPYGSNARDWFLADIDDTELEMVSRAVAEEETVISSESDEEEDL